MSYLGRPGTSSPLAEDEGRATNIKIIKKTLFRIEYQVIVSSKLKSLLYEQQQQFFTQSY